MKTGPWFGIVDATAKRLELAAMLGAAVKYDAASSGWLARVLREMSEKLDVAAKDRALIVTSFSVLGLTIVVKRNDSV